MTTRTRQRTPGPVHSRLTLRTLTVLGLLAVQVLLGTASVHFAPPGTHISAYWPNAGLSVIALAMTAPRWRPALLPALYVVAVLGNLVGGRDLDVSLALGVVNVVEPWVVVWLLTRRGPDPARLRSLADLPRLLAAVLAGAVVAGVIGGLTVATLTSGEFLVTVRAMLASHGAALLVLTPFAMRTVPLRTRRSRLEAVVQWSCLLVVTVAVYASNQDLPLTFAPFPLLVWGALRFTTRQTTVQLLVYGTAMSALTTDGQGPFVQQVAAAGHHPELVGTLLQANLVAAALVALVVSLVRTQQVLTLDRLTRSHELVSNILASTTGTAIVGLDDDSRIEFFNVGAERLTGYRALDVVGKARAVLVPIEGDVPHIIFSPEGAIPEERITGLLAPVFASGEKHVVADWPWIRRDGEKRTVQITVSRRYGDDGEPIGYLAVAEDVTERRHQEASVAAALETEKQLVERLAQVDQTKNDFLATVSHELRTPITSILGYSQLLLSDDTGTLPTMHHQIVGRIERNGRRLMGLIEDMLTMSQVEVGNVRFHRVPIDLREPVTAALEAIQPVLTQRNLTMVHELGETAVKVSGDADKLERVFTNLLSNAAKFSHEGDTIEVGLCTEGHEAVLSVTDTGIGISLEDQAHLFDRFFRSADAHALAIQGVGLGLPIAASIVAGHDGCIDVRSLLGRGSTFAVRLPLITEADPTP